MTLDWMARSRMIPQRLSSGDDFLRSLSIADATGHLAQPKLNVIFDPLRLKQSCAKVFAGVDEPNPSIATEPINRFLVPKREIASERLVTQHAHLCHACASCVHVKRTYV